MGNDLPIELPNGVCNCPIVAVNQQWRILVITLLAVSGKMYLSNRFDRKFL